LNPLANQIYARVQPQTDKNPKQVTYAAQIDGYRLIADRTKQYAGNDDPTYDDASGIPGIATVTVYKLVGGVRCPFTASARWKQYCPGGNQAFMWTKMPHLMLGKCAEALALRKAFPAELSGLYTVEEMAQAGDVEENPYRKEAEQRKPASPPPEPSTNGKAPAKPAPKKAKTWADCGTATELAKALADMKAKHPVNTAVEKWQGIYKECLGIANERIVSTAWKLDDCDELNQVLDNVQSAINLETQSQEAFSGKS
jgi:hypothetical protein